MTLFLCQCRHWRGNEFFLHRLQCFVLVRFTRSQLFGLYFLRRFNSSDAIFAKFGTNRRKISHSPKKDLYYSKTVVDVSSSHIASAVWLPMSSWPGLITWPRLSILFLKNAHFFKLSVTPAFFRNCSANLIRFRWTRVDLDNITM